MPHSFFKKIIVTKPFWLALLAFFLIGLFSLITLRIINDNRTILGLALNGIEAGGLNENQLKNFLEEKTVRFNDQKITVAYENRTWSLAPADFGIEIDTNKTASAALAYGHENNSGVIEQIKALIIGQDLPLEYSINSSKFKQSLGLLSSLQTPAKNASLKYESQKNDFVIAEAETGISINRAKLIADILQTFKEHSQIIFLSLVEEKPLVTGKEIALVAEDAKKLINEMPFFLQSDNTTWRLDKAEIAGWISTAPSTAPSNDDPQKTLLTLDLEQISNFLIPLSVSINREPIDAKLTSANGELKFLILSQNGIKLNIEASARKIAEDILANKKNIYLITDSIAPQVSNQTTEELGLLTLIGRGESNFSGSPANRRINIKVGSTKLNGFLIKPNAEFSFGQNIGDIDAQNGWVPELVIKNNQNIPEFGGGLCQVSTTLFRAAINSGLKITKRYPHAYPVHYYDPPGFDATVYPPNPDLEFINNTPGHLLLQTKIEGNKLIFEIYGTDDGREVKVKGPFVTQKNPDGSLKTILTREIWRDGQLAETNIFRSSYKSAALFPIVKSTPTPTPAPSTTPSP